MWTRVRLSSHWAACVRIVSNKSQACSTIDKTPSKPFGLRGLLHSVHHAFYPLERSQSLTWDTLDIISTVFVHRYITTIGPRLTICTDRIVLKNHSFTSLHFGSHLHDPTGRPTLGANCNVARRHRRRRDATTTGGLRHYGIQWAGIEKDQPGRRRRFGR